jgi:hypothetical protein
MAVVTFGYLANEGAFHDSSSGELRLDLVGIPLAPGWLLLRDALENAKPHQFFGWFLLIVLVSVVIDTGLIFGGWELFHRRRARWSDSNLRLPPAGN